MEDWVGITALAAELKEINEHPPILSIKTYFDIYVETHVNTYQQNDKYVCIYI